MESNPPILSALGHALGLNEAYGFRDVMGYDPELFFLLPDEIFSIIQLFPSSVKTPGSEEDQTANLSPFFLNQIPALDDACGTIALVHSLLNQRERLGLSSGILIDYFNRVKELSPVVRGNSLASDPKIYELHCKQSAQGQTEVPEDGVSSGHHFVCFVPFQKGDERYVVELDGCKRFPTLHQSYTVDEELGADKSFAQAAFAAIKKAYIDPNPGVEDFATIAFGTAPVDEDD